MLLGEEVATSKLTLFDVTKQICDAIQSRGEQGIYHLRKTFYWYCAGIRGEPALRTVSASTSEVSVDDFENWFCYWQTRIME